MKKLVFALLALMMVNAGCRTTQSRAKSDTDFDVFGPKFVDLERNPSDALDKALDLEMVESTLTDDENGKRLGFKIWSNLEGDKIIHCDIYRLSIVTYPLCRIKLAKIEGVSAEQLYASLKIEEKNVEDYNNNNALGYLVATKEVDLQDHELKCERRRYSIMNKFICSIHKKGEASLEPSDLVTVELNKGHSKTLYEVLKIEAVKTPHSGKYLEYKNWYDADNFKRIHCETIAENNATHNECTVALGTVRGPSAHKLYEILLKDETKTDDATYYSNNTDLGHLAATKQIELGNARINCERRRFSVMDTFICYIEETGN